MKKNVFTDIAAHPLVYLFVFIFGYLIGIASSGMGLGKSANGVGMIIFLLYFYSVAFVYGTYIELRYNRQYSGKLGILAFLFASFVVAAPIVTFLYVYLERFLAGDL